MTYIDCLTGPDALFTCNMSTKQMMQKVSVLHFRDQWSGLPEMLKVELTSAIEKTKAKGHFLEPTVTGTGTTLMDVAHLLSPRAFAVMHVVLAANYYGVGGLRP